MTTAVTLHVHHLDLTDDATLGALASFEDATFGASRGLTTMTVYVDEGRDVVSTTIGAARKLSHVVPGTKAVRVDPDLVTASDIASRVGVSREAVRKWTCNARSPFPIPFDNVNSDAQNLWRWVDIVPWLLEAKGIDIEEDLPTPAAIAEIDAYLARVPDRLSEQPSRTGANVLPPPGRGALFRTTSDH